MPGCTDCPSNQIDGKGSEPVFRRVLWIALIANFVVELVASQLGDSMSLQADALDFFGDSANYAISLFVAGMALTVRARASLFKGATMALLALARLVRRRHHRCAEHQRSVPCRAFGEDRIAHVCG